MEYILWRKPPYEIIENTMNFTSEAHSVYKVSTLVLGT